MEREQTAAFVVDDVLEKIVNMYMQLTANVEKQMKIIKLQDCKASRFCSTSPFLPIKVDVHEYLCVPRNYAPRSILGPSA